MIPYNAIYLCKKWEGFHRRGKDGLAYPYLCPAGYWTIGYGSTRMLDGQPVTQHSPPVSEKTARLMLENDLKKCVASAILYSPILIHHEERLGAIASFIYNLGAGRYKASTLRKRVNEGNWELARTEILRWVYGAGVRLPGLIARRREESLYLVEKATTPKPVIVKLPEPPQLTPAFTSISSLK